MAKLLIGLAILFCGLMIFAIARPEEGPKAPPPAIDPVDTALTGCERWTGSNSKLAMGEIVKEYRITARKLEPNHYLVGIDYRGGASGLLMTSRCEYVLDGNQMALVEAHAGVKQ